MKIILIVFGALAGAVIGWLAAAFVTITFGGYFGLTEFEGQRSMTAVFGIGPVGGLIGLVAGILMTRRLSA